MDTLLIKMFATALTLSQVTTAPDAIKTEFDRTADQPRVAELLRAGCLHMRKAFDVEDINIDDLIATAMDDPDAVSGGAAVFRGINFKDLVVAYRQFCKNEQVKDAAVDLGDVIDFYNKAMANLPDHTRLKGLKLPGASIVLDGKGERFAEVFESDGRRVFVTLSDVPQHVQKAFVSAEDKRFFEHKGIDERALIRAFIGNLAQSGRPQGGSTITQQVVKNLLVGDDLSYERKMREMVVTTRVERTLSKAEILELYLNSTFLGRGAWGIETAARTYFGKPAKELSVSEAALLAGITKGPNHFSPDRQPARAQERWSYVLTRMQEDGVITADEQRLASNAGMPALIPYERPRRDSGFHFVDHVAREARTVAGIATLTTDSYTIRSTIRPDLQRATEAALQEGLASYEIHGGRARFSRAEAHLVDAVRRIEAERKSAAAGAQPEKPAKPVKPAWQQALENARLPLYDVHWPAAIVVEKSAAKGGGEITRVGLADGRILQLAGASSATQRLMKQYDVVFVNVTEGKAKTAARAELRVRPSVQGAAVVLENKTGKILAMAGGFSYPLSQLNRATQSQRQPGSALKPLTYLAALQKGLQPNTLVRDTPLSLPPIAGNYARDRDYWTPKNYEGGSSGIITLRRALEHSRNLATAQLLDGGIEYSPSASLDRVCALAIEAQLYKECERYYPFILGAQPVRPIDLAAFYAAVANEGVRPAPYAVESIENNGKVIYRHPAKTSAEIASADRVSFFQLKTMLQGVLLRGTARSIASLAPYVGGKTGTTDGENDAWFVGFTNDVTVAVWVGYDNANGRRTLGGGVTGSSAAIPIFTPIIQAVWSRYAPRAALAPPSPEARRNLVIRGVEPNSGDAASEAAGGSPGKFTEYFRRDRDGGVRDTQYKLVSREELYATYAPFNETGPFGGYDENGHYAPRTMPRDPWQMQQSPYGVPRPQQPFGGLFGWPQQQPQPQPQQRLPQQRTEPNPFWNRRYD